MASKALIKFKNYVDVANNYKQNQNLYFFIKNFAFTRAYNVLSKDYSGVSESDRLTFDNMMSEYKQEKAIAKPTYVMSKEEYTEFLEFFFNNVNVDSCNLYMLEVCRDLTEVLGVYGEFDDLWARRMEYFNKKIITMGGGSNNQNNYNILGGFQPMNTNSNSTSNQPSKSVVELITNLPVVKNSSEEEINIPNMGPDYIPRLVDRSIKFPVAKKSQPYNKVKELIKMHMEYSGLELDFHKLDLAKDHIEAAIYYLRNIQ